MLSRYRKYSQIVDMCFLIATVSQFRCTLYVIGCFHEYHTECDCTLPNHAGRENNFYKKTKSQEKAARGFFFFILRIFRHILFRGRRSAVRPKNLQNSHFFCQVLIVPIIFGLFLV